MVVASIGAIIAAVAAVAGAVISYTGQQRAAKKIAAAQRETNAINTAQQRIENNRNVRRAFRERRIIAAKIAQSAENTGTGGSSGDIGAQSGIGAAFGDLLSINSSRILASNAITVQQQNIADARRSAAKADALGSLIASVGGAVGSAVGSFGGSPKGISGGTVRTAPDSGQVRGFQFGRFGGGV